MTPQEAITSALRAERSRRKWTIAKMVAELKKAGHQTNATTYNSLELGKNTGVHLLYKAMEVLEVEKIG